MSSPRKRAFGSAPDVHWRTAQAELRAFARNLRESARHLRRKECGLSLAALTDAERNHARLERELAGAQMLSGGQGERKFVKSRLLLSKTHTAWRRHCKVVSR